MMKTYSHIRRKALDEAAATLEPPDIASWETKPEKQSPDRDTDQAVTSQSTSQSDNLEGEIDDLKDWLLRLDSNQQPSG
jgi:type IV secretory pathway VirB10-like protein